MSDPVVRVHVFSHFGPGPYTYLGYEKKLFVIPGCPPRAGSTCDHCSTAIADCFWFRTADGKKFKVGSTCVEKSGDRGLKKVIAADVAKARRETARQLDERKTAELDALLSDEAVRAKLATFPHLFKWAADKGATRLDYVLTVRKMAGASGRAQLLKLVKNTMKS